MKSQDVLHRHGLGKGKGGEVEFEEMGTLPNNTVYTPSSSYMAMSKKYLLSYQNGYPHDYSFVNLDTNTLIVRSTTDHPIDFNSGIVADEQDDYFYCGKSGQGLVCYHPINGVKWSNPTIPGAHRMYLYGDLVYAIDGKTDTSLYEVSRLTGNIIRSVNLPYSYGFNQIISVSFDGSKILLTKGVNHRLYVTIVDRETFVVIKSYELYEASKFSSVVRQIAFLIDNILHYFYESNYTLRYFKNDTSLTSPAFITGMTSTSIDKYFLPSTNTGRSYWLKDKIVIEAMPGMKMLYKTPDSVPAITSYLPYSGSSRIAFCLIRQGRYAWAGQLGNIGHGKVSNFN